MEVRRKLPFDPEELPPGSPPALSAEGDSGSVGGGGGWVPMCRHACTFETRYFDDIMLNLVRNPNLNSKWLFRADVLYDDGDESQPHNKDSIKDWPSIPDFHGLIRQRTIVRRLIPRNTLRDAPLDQTCTFYASSPTPESEDSPEGKGLIRSLTVYLPHATSAARLPYYHPKVRGVGQLHEWDPATDTGTISIHFLPFADEAGTEDADRDADRETDRETDREADRVKLGRVAHHLLQTIHKHGHANAVGYVKRVNHDVVVPRERFQDRYSELKNKYARGLTRSWLETTDPSKHVFEDLGIAAFLIELWRDMYKDAEFPGFVDIGCGNGLLVHILREEGYTGWGFDARERKSWAQYNGSSSMSPSGKSLQRLLLLPSVVPKEVANGEQDEVGPDDIHDGIFPKGTFIISNHADELTPWTPILAAISVCPFIMIPCCSHNLTGDRWRAPPPRDKSKSKSAFASLVDWVTLIAGDCGWQVETEMLRIPSTRNTGLLGRTRTKHLDRGDIDRVLQKYGGVGNYYNNVVRLLKSKPRGH